MRTAVDKYAACAPRPRPFAMDVRDCHVSRTCDPAASSVTMKRIRIALGGLELDRSTLDEADRIIAARGADPASGPDH